MKTVLDHRFPIQSGARVLSFALMVCYLALMGEAIHCQYYNHATHHHTSGPVKDHKAHCAAAGHCAAAIQTSTLTDAHPLPVSTLILNSNPGLDGFALVRSNIPRAPPSLSSAA
jgi:hypothetical protein